MSGHIHINTSIVGRFAVAAVFALSANMVFAQSVQGTGARSLEATHWKAVELAGRPTPAQDPTREAHLVFQAGRLSGSDGCNRITGGYTVKGNALAFGQIAATAMACIGTAADIERAFRGALKSAARFTLSGDRLELLDGSGNRVAAFTAGAQPSPASNICSLEGSSWQLVEFQGSDGETLTPDDRSKYAIEFGARGQLSARVDCNRGRGSWKSAGPSQVQFGPLALTRAKCPVGSLHDQIVKQWGNIRSYVIKDGHLFLSLMADGGIYEFEPIKKSPALARRRLEPREWRHRPRSASSELLRRLLEGAAQRKTSDIDGQKLIDLSTTPCSCSDGHDVLVAA